MTEGQPASSSGRVIQPLWQGLFAGEWDGGGGENCDGGDRFAAHLNKFLVESVELRFKGFRGFEVTPLIIPEIQSHYLDEWAIDTCKVLGEPVT